MNSLAANVTGVVLAGGKSRRMGRDKRFLDVGGQALLKRVCETMASLFTECLLSVAEPSPELEGMGHRLVVDEIPDCASLGGLYTGLLAATNSRIFVVACDMPFITHTTIQRILELSEDYDVVMARLATGLQPMHAVYSKACLPSIQRMMKNSTLKIQMLAQTPSLKTKIVNEKEVAPTPEELLSFLNINTPMDLEMARKLFNQPRPKHN